jgi:hypothetical protein
MDNTPGFSGEIPDGYTTGVETIGRCLPRKPGKFCTLIYTDNQPSMQLLEKLGFCFSKKMMLDKELNLFSLDL